MFLHQIITLFFILMDKGTNNNNHQINFVKKIKIHCENRLKKTVDNR